MQKNDWRPKASHELIKQRAKLYHKVRCFFEERNVLEVETPLLGLTNCPDRHIEPFLIPQNGETFCLQTSPEFYMKRLLADGLGSIYQICKAFRQGEAGQNHNPEFTMLEWYRVGWDYEQLIQEVEALLDGLLHSGKAIHIEYRALFMEYCQFDPWAVDVTTLQKLAKQQDGVDLELDLDGWLDYFLTHHIEPKFEKDKLYVIKHFLPSQAALSKINQDGPYPYAERFECYYQGIELANGYHELTCSLEQRKRFETELHWRRSHNLPMLKQDEKLLAALEKMPACSGVAMGLDRILMLITKAKSLSEVLAFPFIVTA